MELVVIGAIDSGIGGIGLVNLIKSKRPDLPVIYVADNKFLPYGDKSAEDIKQRCLEIGRFLISQKVSKILLACNTATAVAVDYLREQLEIELVGIEPAIKPACKQHLCIGVLSTKNTINSKRYLQLKQNFSKQSQIIDIECPEFATMVEEQAAEANLTKQIESVLLPVFSNHGNISLLILGCTHYLFLKDQIIKVLQANDINCELWDNSESVVTQLVKGLTISKQPVVSENLLTLYLTDFSKETAYKKFLTGNSFQNFAINELTV